MSIRRVNHFIVKCTHCYRETEVIDVGQDELDVKEHLERKGWSGNIFNMVCPSCTKEREGYNNR